MNENTENKENTDSELVKTSNDQVNDQESKEPDNQPKNYVNSLIKLSLALIVIGVVLLSVWGVGRLVMARNLEKVENESTLEPSPLPSPQVVFSTETFITPTSIVGMPRDPEVLTTITTEEATPQVRTDVITYIVEPLDSIFSIAEKFGLKPETILWSNRYTLGDTPDGLYVGDELFILPEDGVYHMWSEGEGLNGVSGFYGVEPDVIVDYPLNNLDRATLGDYSLPNIKPGTMLIVPNGTRPTVSWIIARENPAEGSRYLGDFYCVGTIYGWVGTGSFTWPTPDHSLSGYDWNPPVHNGLDFQGVSGSPIYAADTGVVVYSGWSDRGYGNLLVIDHDGGWQTMYAHLLDYSFVPCGSNVSKGQVIASMGSTGRSTGPHLHFELRINGAAVNPWNYLQ